jgi:hypothetical protein
MRYTKGFAQAQKREEKAIFDCYYESLKNATMDGQRDNLEYVRINLIEGTNDLTIKVFENFLNVCVELNCSSASHLLEVLTFHPVHKGKGHGYKIPSKTKDPIGHAMARSSRNEWRMQFRMVHEQSGSQMKPVLRIVR